MLFINNNHTCALLYNWHCLHVSCRLLGNFSVVEQNRVDQSVPLLRLVLAEPLQSWPEKFVNILSSVFFAPRCSLNADSWFKDITCLRSPLYTTKIFNVRFNKWCVNIFYVLIATLYSIMLFRKNPFLK